MRISDWSSDVCSSDLPQIGQCIADFGALVEAETADDAVFDTDLDEAILELARLVLRAHQYGDRIKAGAFALQPFDFFAHAPRFLRPVPHNDDAQLFAVIDLGPQGLSQPFAVGADQPRRCAQDMRGGAMVMPTPDYLGAGEILFETQDIGNFRAAP